MWRDIDPERTHPTLPSPDEAPFAWTDRESVPQTERARFSPPDVRSEMVPCYPIATPDMSWRTEDGPSPSLDPEILAETWQPADVRGALSPLVDGYNLWIATQRQLIGGLPASRQPIAASHIQQCIRAAERLQNAIDILATDEDARLAFCFANKAIAMQSQWARGAALTWRPFQLAFILLNVPALADPTHADRRICDLLWFPTGGGKTESYLGLTAFVLALRRLRSHQQNATTTAGTGTGVLSRYTLRLLTIQQFRRAVGIITACEVLRVWNLDSSTSPVGWRPQGCANNTTFLWGGARFAAGLWVGGGVTPNNLLSVGPIPGPGGFTFYVGALDILQGASARATELPWHQHYTSQESSDLALYRG